MTKNTYGIDNKSSGVVHVYVMITSVTHKPAGTKQRSQVIVLKFLFRPN